VLFQPITKRDRERKRRVIAEHDVDFARCEYEASGNPIHAWEAYLLARKARVPAPESVLAYFDGVAARISSLARHRVPRKNAVASAVASAVGLACRGRHNPFDPFDGWARPGHELMIAMTVYTCYSENWSKQRQGLDSTHKQKALYEAAATTHNRTCDCGRQISWKTAERFFRKHATVVIPGHLQQQAKSQKLADILR
jgi:hypothetical protein